MPSVHANPRSSAPSESRRRPVVLASLLLALLLGLVSVGAWWGGWFGAKEDPRLTELKTVMADAAAKYPPDQAPKNMLETAARVGTMVSVMAKIQSLPEELRPKAMEEGRKLMMKGMEARVDSYFAAPPNQRQKLIDDQLKQMQSMQKAFEGSRSMFQGLAGQGGGQAGGAQGAGRASNQQTAGRPASRSEEDRNNWRKRMIDGSSPSQRARWTEYFGEVEKRRQALGLPGGGGPFGPR
ncbi:MAG: hypothetical protein EXS06_00525 [Planctomycetaceae bacterium]|nr:hypothetical protein [Planctomycetaceae bacterium]